MSVNLNTPLNQICNSHSSGRNNFVDKIRNKQVGFDPVAEFARGIKLGEGAFGLVKRVQYPSDNGSISIALKRVNSNDSSDSKMIAKELAALEALKDSNYIPKFFGCISHQQAAQGYKRAAGQHIYIALELLSRGLDSSSFKTHLKSASKADSLTLFSHMFKGLRDMNNQELAHNDIKPANMMTNADMTRVYLIDLGLASGSKDRILMGGTPIFMPPSKFTSGYNLPNYKPKDDMYSIALSIADLLSTKKDEVFARPGQFTFNPDCIRNQQFVLTTGCRNTIFENVKKILTNAGYGAYSSSATKENINFTTLIANMISYDNFSFSVKDVIEVMERLISATNPKADQNANRVREEALKQEARIQELERNKRRGEDEVMAKRQQFKKYLEEQENQKLKAFGEHDKLVQIEKNIHDSKKQFKQEAGQKYKEILQAKKEAEQLIEKAKQNDKAHLKDDQFFKNGAGGFKRYVPAEQRQAPAAGVVVDPILAHYKVQNLSKYDLQVLIPALKAVRFVIQAEYDKLVRERVVGLLAQQKKQLIEQEEKRKVIRALERAEIKGNQGQVNNLAANPRGFRKRRII